jgi:transcriptional regulator with XRE-family HTH domain
MPARPHHRRRLRRHYLKEWREYRGLSQEQGAERLGLSRTQLSKIENLKSPYSQALLEAAADAYQCEPADLIMRNPAVQGAPWSIYESLKKAPEPTQRQIQTIIETLLKTGS